MRGPVLAAIAVAMLVAPTGAGAAVIKTNWSERFDYPSAKGFLRVYVRRIELTPSSWTASWRWVKAMVFGKL